MSTRFSIGQMNQLGDALEGAGFAPEHVTQLHNSQLLPDFKQVLLGYAEVRTLRHVIDCTVEPLISGDWTIEKHEGLWQIEWPEQVGLFLSDDQKNRNAILGYKLLEELEGKSVLNACVLDWLLDHQEFIPKEWKKDSIFFWGTIWLDKDDVPHVQGLVWSDTKWVRTYRWIRSDFRYGNPVAVRVS